MDPVDAAPNPLLGFARARRLRSVEIAMLSARIPEAAFHKTKNLRQFVQDESQSYSLPTPP